MVNMCYYKSVRYQGDRAQAASAASELFHNEQPCQGWGREFESHRPLQ